jgi:hypothetical protein
MMSIKEKSNEYAREYLFSPLPKSAPNVHFEEGANYVLEQIEKQLGEFSNFEDSLIVRRVIEELKKK